MDASGIHWQGFNLKRLASWPNVLAIEGNSVMWCWMQWVGPSGIFTTGFCCTTHTSHCLLQRGELHRDDSLPHTYEWPFGAKRWPSTQQAMVIISRICTRLLKSKCNFELAKLICFYYWAFMSTRNKKMYKLMNNLRISWFIHLIFPVRAGAAICQFYVRGFQSHLLPAIFSCTKQHFFLYDTL